MSKNNRQFPRHEIKIEVDLQFPGDEPRKAITRDLSDGGLFLQINNPAHYTMGEMVSLNFKNPLEDFKETDKDAIIVRQTDNGIAVAFIEIEDF